MCPPLIKTGIKGCPYLAKNPPLKLGGIFPDWQLPFTNCPGCGSSQVQEVPLKDPYVLGQINECLNCGATGGPAFF